MNKDYQELWDLSKRIETLKSISHLLDWDQETYMPSASYLFRSNQIELLSSLIHLENTGPRFKKALAKLIDLDSGKILAKNLTFEEKRCLSLWRRDFLKAKALPDRFVKKWAQLTSESTVIWAQAKKENKFSLFAPYLEKIVGLCHEKIAYLGYEDHPYDALLDEYDPERKTQEIDRLFQEMATFIPRHVKKWERAIPDAFLYGSFDEKKQLELGKIILEGIGYDFTKGRLDLSNHPFSSTFHPTDSRITTRIKKEGFMEAISAIIHEAGHSFYEMGMDPSFYGSPLCEAISLTIHESQSRIWEVFVGQSLAFWTHFFPFVQKIFKKQFASISLQAFYAAINKITKTPIRIEADELSYSLHVIVRFEIEKALMQGDLKVREIPEAWNSLMKKLLNITPKNDREGCLQDIHWAMGGFGYFPTYALGNLCAAAFYKSYKKKNRRCDEEIAQGNFFSFKEFLQENIYIHGRLYTTDELLLRVTKEKLSTKPYFEYLTEKYESFD